MPIYQYRCPNCLRRPSFSLSIEEYTRDQWDTNSVFCAHCPTVALKRVYTAPSIRPSFEDGYNTSLGRYVATERDLRNGFKEASESATLRTGLEHRFVPHDPRDPDVAAQLGVTDEGLDSTRARNREMGLTDRKSFG